MTVTCTLLCPTVPSALVRHDESPSPRAGFGRCSRCDCREYEGGPSSHVCHNCGDSYDDHY
jgi:hypothetical protein